MIEIALTGAKITSAGGKNPEINTVFMLEEMDHTDLDNQIRAIVDEEINLSEIEALKAPDELTGGSEGATSDIQKEVNSLQETFENLKESPFGSLADLTREQTANLASFSKDPFGFIITRVLKKASKGAGIVLLATIIFSAVKLIISELMKPGRILDRRFKRVAKDEILLFNSREEQAELRQGFRTVTITTVPFLRGSELRGQISGNLYNPSAIPMNRLDERRVIPPVAASQYSSRGAKFFSRRNRR